MKKILEVLIIAACLQFVYAQKSTEEINGMIAKMTIDEKIGQMTQVDYDAIKANPDHIAKYFLGSILWGGGSEPASLAPKGWADIYDSYQGLALKTRLQIPLLFGIDAVHGNSNVDGATIFPHNVGLGATRNSSLIEKIGYVTAVEMKATGVQWAFSPCVAVARDERWGRTYESFSEDPSIVKDLGAAYVRGMQTTDISKSTSALACVKHYVGDGGTENGKDQGYTNIDEKTLREIHLQGYISSIKDGALSIMVSYNSWNGNKMHGHKYLLTDVLKNELQFKGFLVSDWAAIDQLSPNYKYAIETSINAGLDMVMIPNGVGANNNYIQFTELLKQLVAEGTVPMSRIDDAVRRILFVKSQMGMFASSKRDQSLFSSVGTKEHREIARDAVRQSIVLLKNEKGLLPLSKNLKKILIAGKGANDIGMQCGGWTISWQGGLGNTISGGTTILDAIKKSVSKKTEVVYSESDSNLQKADVAVVVIGEHPYAEMFGDRKDLSLTKEDAMLVQKIKEMGIPVVTLLISGRPMILDGTLDQSDAFAAIWLPGTEGAGVADVVFGDFKPVGKLPHSWPRTMAQIPINFGDSTYDPLFPLGYGLTFEIESKKK